MVNLDSYDSEGPVTPETDDSTEVRSQTLPHWGRFSPVLRAFLALSDSINSGLPRWLLLSVKMSASSANDLAYMLLSI